MSSDVMASSPPSQDSAFGLPPTATTTLPQLKTRSWDMHVNMYVGPPYTAEWTCGKGIYKMRQVRWFLGEFIARALPENGAVRKPSGLSIADALEGTNYLKLRKHEVYIWYLDLCGGTARTFLD